MLPDGASPTSGTPPTVPRLISAIKGFERRDPEIEWWMKHSDTKELDTKTDLDNRRMGVYDAAERFADFWQTPELQEAVDSRKRKLISSDRMGRRERVEKEIAQIAAIRAAEAAKQDQRKLGI